MQDNVVRLDDMPDTPGRSTYYENGTAMTRSICLWLSLAMGNRSPILILWLSDSSLTQDDIIEAPVLAGFDYTVVDGESTFEYSELYQKSTGALYNLLSETIHAGDVYYLHIRTEISLIEGSNWTIVAVTDAVVFGAQVFACRGREHLTQGFSSLSLH